MTLEQLEKWLERAEAYGEGKPLPMPLRIIRALVDGWPCDEKCDSHRWRCRKCGSRSHIKIHYDTCTAPYNDSWERCPCTCQKPGLAEALEGIE